MEHDDAICAERAGVGLGLYSREKAYYMHKVKSLNVYRHTTVGSVNHSRFATSRGPCTALPRLNVSDHAKS